MKNEIFWKEKISYFIQSVSTKMVIIILVLILPLNILAIVLSDMALNNVVDQTKLSVTNVMQNYLTDIEDRMQHQSSLFYSMRNNDANGIIISRQIGGKEYNKARQQFFNSIRSLLTLAKTTDGAFMYMKDMDDILIWNMDTHLHSIENMRDYIRQLSKDRMLTGWKFLSVPGKEGNGNGYPMLWCFTEFRDVCSGGWVELDNVAEKLKKDLQYQNVQVLFDDTEIISDNPDKIVISTYFSKANMYVAVQLDQKEVNGTILSIYLTLKNFSVLALVLIPFLYYILHILLLLPLKKIKEAHVEIESGNADYRITEKANSIEYRQVYISFNQMADNLKNLKIENYEKELEKQKMELKNLQLQIRPHFLLNTFNLIYTLAQDGETEYMQKIMLYLSDYFRYMFRSDKELELFGKEQKLIEGYINMTQIRYPNSIEIEYKYDPEISFVRIPPLLLHNFVENIIKHVVQSGIATHISLIGEYREGVVYLKVIDDGPGMSPDQKQEIDKNMRSGIMTGNGVGMANAYRRLKYFYGEEADITILSELGVGTTVLIKFPYNLERIVNNNG